MSVYELSWSRPQGRLPYSAQDRNGILTLHDTTEADSGIYQCEAVSRTDSTRLTAQARLNVRASYYPPPVPQIDPERLDLAQGDTSTMTCVLDTASARPGAQSAPPQIVWSKVE